MARPDRTRIVPVSTILAVVFLLVLPRAHGVQIMVDALDGDVDGSDNVCSLSEAIQNANDGGQTNADCLAGTSGSDTILLTVDVTLGTGFVDLNDGRNGTPTVTTSITVDGQGHTVRRGGPACSPDGTLDSDEFRLFHISSGGGTLVVDDTRLEDGCVDGRRISRGGRPGVISA